MSLDWLWETEEGTIALLVGLLFAFIMISISFGRARVGTINKACGLVGNDDKPTRSIDVTVIAKFINESPSCPNLKLNNVVFETAEKKRYTFVLKEQKYYDAILEGDHGLLTFQGTRFIRFERDTK